MRKVHFLEHDYRLKNEASNKDFEKKFAKFMVQL